MDVVSACRRRFCLAVVAWLLPTSLFASSIRDVSFFGFGDSLESFSNPDVREGLRSLLAGEEWAYGLPTPLFRQQFAPKDYDPDYLWRLLGTVPSPPWREMGDVPLSLSDSRFMRGDADLININCFACHAGVVAGQVVAGLGSAHADSVSFNAATKKLIDTWESLIGRIGISIALNSSERKSLSNFLAYQKSIVLPVVQAQSRGENFGPWVVWQHIARMVDPAKGMETYPPTQASPLQALLERPLPPVDPSPWWNLRYKDRDFWTRDVTLNSLPTFALNLMDTAPDNTATFPARMERMRRYLAFAAQTVSPPYPERFGNDDALAERGYALFHAKTTLANGHTLPCQGCHGTYSLDGQLLSYPNREVVPLSIIGTDGAYATLLNQTMKPLYAHYTVSPFIPSRSDYVTWPAVAGYAPPPLKGIWASAPYFHNGSVPTVYEVLKSTARPKYWVKNLDPFAYDTEKLGHAATPINGETLAQWRQEADISGDPLSDASLKARSVYDTTLYGRGNQGHTFGDAMTHEERMAVIAFLKRL